MKLVKKYTAIQLFTERVNNTLNVCLAYGDIEGPFYSQTSPEEEFETEEEAIDYAYKKSKYSKYIILPIIRFDN